jgi:hypothetical protein
MIELFRPTPICESLLKIRKTQELVLSVKHVTANID